MADGPSVGRLRLRTDIVEWRPVENEIVALDLRTCTYISVNPSGAVLWPVLAEGAGRQELVDKLVESFGINHEVASRDLDDFLNVLVERGLVESADANESSSTE